MVISMGKKLSFEYVEQYCQLHHNQSIHIFGDKHGYRYNVNHPLIRELYEKYKNKKEIPLWCPLSDRQRQEFEILVDCWFEKNKG